MPTEKMAVSMCMTYCACVFIVHVCDVLWGGGTKQKDTKSLGEEHTHISTPTHTHYSNTYTTHIAKDFPCKALKHVQYYNSSTRGLLGERERERIKCQAEQIP